MLSESTFDQFVELPGWVQPGCNNLRKLREEAGGGGGKLRGLCYTILGVSEMKITDF